MEIEETPQLPPALQSVRLPELGGTEVGWTMCRNRLCENYGILVTTHPPFSSDILQNA